MGDDTQVRKLSGLLVLYSCRSARGEAYLESERVKLRGEHETAKTIRYPGAGATHIPQHPIDGKSGGPSCF